MLKPLAGVRDPHAPVRPPRSPALLAHRPRHLGPRGSLRSKVTPRQRGSAGRSAWRSRPRPSAGFSGRGVGAAWRHRRAPGPQSRDREAGCGRSRLVSAGVLLPSVPHLGGCLCHLLSPASRRGFRQFALSARDPEFTCGLPFASVSLIRQDFCSCPLLSLGRFCVCPSQPGLSGQGGAGLPGPLSHRR